MKDFKLTLLLSCVLLPGMGIQQSLGEENKITLEDIVSAEQFVTKYFPVPREDFDEWIIIDNENTALDLSLFTFDKVQINRAWSIITPLCYTGITEGEWYLLIDKDTRKKIDIPKGYELWHLINCDLCTIYDRKTNARGIFNISEQKMLHVGKILYSCIDNFLVVLHSIYDDSIPKNDRVIHIYDLKKNTHVERPQYENDLNYVYSYTGEHLFQMRTLPSKDGQLVRDLGIAKGSLLDLNFNKIADLPQGWLLSDRLYDGTARATCFRPGGGNGIINNKGEVLYETPLEILPRRDGYFRITTADSTVYYADEYGKKTIDSEYVKASPFVGGFAYVTTYMRDEYAEEDKLVCHKIDEKGNKIKRIKTGFEMLDLLPYGLGISRELVSSADDDWRYVLSDGNNRQFWVAPKDRKKQEEFKSFYYKLGSCLNY